MIGGRFERAVGKLMQPHGHGYSDDLQVAIGMDEDVEFTEAVKAYRELVERSARKLSATAGRAFHAGLEQRWRSLIHTPNNGLRADAVPVFTPITGTGHNITAAMADFLHRAETNIREKGAAVVYSDPGIFDDFIKGDFEMDNRKVVAVSFTAQFWRGVPLEEPKL